MPDRDVIVIGAGIVGVSSALWTALRGHNVTLIDPNPPGSGTSFGNACTFATYGCLPVNDPSVFTNLPALLLQRDSPLALSFWHALRHPRWMLSFLANCRRHRSDAIAKNLAGLLAHADAGINPLITEAGAEDLVVANGQMSIWTTQAGAASAGEGIARRRDLGVVCEELTSDEVLSLEPALANAPLKGVLHPEARHLRDPLELVTRMHRRFAALGGQTLVARATSTRDAGTEVIVETDHGPLTASHVILAAGAFSANVRGSGAEGLPLGTERGYHVLYAGEGHRLSRPVGWSEAGFYATPMAQGLRCAGTVEIAARDRPPNPARTSAIARRAATMFDGLPEPSSTWLGHRPTMPDSLPVLGPSPASPRILCAFGHQHLGLTLGGITGRIMADLIEGRQPNQRLGPFAANRRYL